MLRVLVMTAFMQALGRPPTDAERAEFLATMARMAGGEYLYVPKLPQSEVNADEVWRMRESGMTIREIADAIGCSTKPICRVLQQPSLLPVSPYEGDKVAA